MENINNAGIYTKINSPDKYSEESSEIQQWPLKILKRQEAKLIKKLTADDSSTYLQYVSQALSYDSISTLSKITSFQQKLANKKNTAINNLRGADGFDKYLELKTNEYNLFGANATEANLVC